MVKVRTSRYEFAHGKKPRGFGQWAFFFHPQEDDSLQAFWHSGSYSDAKKAAQQEARRRNVQEVFLGS